MHIRNFIIQDFDGAVDLWRTDASIGLSSADELENIRHFLERNPGLSKVMVDGDSIVGTILCGHDGRRGYLYHLFVKVDHRRQGIGTTLMNTAMDSLKSEGILKCHLFVFAKNEPGKQFWRAAGWQERADIGIFSKNI